MRNTEYKPCWTLVATVLLRGDDIRNRVLCAIRLMLVWACELKPELNAEMLYNSLQCRPAYIDLVAAAYFVKR